MLVFPAYLMQTSKLVGSGVTPSTCNISLETSDMAFIPSPEPRVDEVAACPNCPGDVASLSHRSGYFIGTTSRQQPSGSSTK